MMLVMPQSRMRDLLQHVPKIYSGSVNNLLLLSHSAGSTIQHKRVSPTLY
jgi:hypothetical protein